MEKFDINEFKARALPVNLQRAVNRLSGQVFMLSRGPHKDRQRKQVLKHQIKKIVEN